MTDYQLNVHQTGPMRGEISWRRLRRAREIYEATQTLYGDANALPWHQLSAISQQYWVNKAAERR